MNVFSCNIDKCGRKFNKKDELKEHCTRRHSGHIGSNSAIPQTKPISDQLHSETPLNLKANKIIMSEIGKLTLKKPFFMPKKKLPTPLLKPSPKEVENANELTQIKQKNENKEDFQIKNNGSSFIEDKSHDNTTFNSISFNKEANENFVGNLVDLSQDKRMFEDLMKDDDDSLEMIESPGIEKLELEQILSSKEKLTEEFLIKKSGICEKLEHITTLVLRDENIYVFESHEKLRIDRFISLEYLCLSHNKLFNLHGVGECVNLIELNVSFNNIEDIYPLKHCQKLEKLWLSNNRISEIKILKELKKLRLVSLYKNKLRSIDEMVLVFRQLPKIEELELDGNPSTRKNLYKYDIIYSVPLLKLDGEVVSEIDYELAKSFKQDRIAKTRNLDDPNLQRPSTAPGKIRTLFQGDGNIGEKNYSDRFKNKIGKLAKEANRFLNDIPETEAAEKFYELEQELEIIKGERNQLKKELEESRNKEDELTLKIKNQEAEAIISKIESNSAYILADENKILKDKLRVFQQIMLDDSKPEAVYLQKLFTAHLKIDELLSQNTKLQAQIGPKLEKNKINAPNFYNTISHFPKYKESNTFTNEKPKISGPVKKTNLNKSVTLFSNYEKSEKELKKNSDDIEKLKYELRSMMESVDEHNHDDSFGDNNVFDPEV